MTSIKIILLTFVLFALACSRPNTYGEGSANIEFPKQWPGSQKNSILSTIAYDKLCFIASVTGEGISSSPARTCDPKLGVFQGSVAPGGTLQLQIPFGLKRDLEIFAYEKKTSSDQCPVLKSGFDQLDRSKIYSVGRKLGFAVTKPEMTIEIKITLPQPSQNLMALLKLPESCGPVATLPVNEGRDPLRNRTIHLSPKYQINGGVSIEGAKHLTGGKYVVELD